MRVTDVRQRRRERPLGVFKGNVELFEQTPYSRILQKDQFGFANHDLLVPVAHMIGVIRPLLRSMRPHHVHRFRSFPNADDGSFRSENHAVAFLKDCSAGKRNSELQSGIGPAFPMSLAAVVPLERESIATISVVSGIHIGCTCEVFNNSHDILKKEVPLSQGQNFGGLTLQEFTVGAHFICFRIDVNVGQGVIELQVGLA